MNDSKMYHMSEDMEDQCITEDSKIRLYLSRVRYEKPEHRKETIVEKISAAALAFFYSVFLSYVIGQWVVRSAAEFRGYEAIGGEYILIIVVFMETFRLMWKLLKGYRGQA